MNLCCFDGFLLDVVQCSQHRTQETLIIFFVFHIDVTLSYLNYWWSGDVGAPMQRTKFFCVQVQSCTSAIRDFEQVLSELKINVVNTN